MSITHVLDVEGSLGGHERLDAGRVTSLGGYNKYSPSLRSARSSYTNPSVLGTHLVPHATLAYSFSVIIYLIALITYTNPINLKT